MEQDSDKSLTLKVAGVDKLCSAISEWLIVPVSAIKASLEDSVASKKTIKTFNAENKLFTSIKDSESLSSEEKFLFIKKHLGDELARIFKKEEKRTRNLQDTVTKALDFIPSEVEGTPVNEDLIDYILGQAQEVSNSKVQDVWALVLAREVTSPGSFSRRTLSRLMLFDKDDVELLQLLSEYALVSDIDPPTGACILCDTFTWQNLKFIQGFNLKYDHVLSMVDAGLLLSREPDVQFGLQNEEGLRLHPIGDNSVKITIKHHEITGFVLTTVGFQLCKLISSKINEEYIGYLCRQFNATINQPENL